MAIADLRREYRLAGLRRADLHPDPIVQFRRWFDQATGARASGKLRRFFIRLYKSLFLVTGMQPTEVNAMTLATADKTGKPSARVVLLKAVDERGFIFFTNYESRKGIELSENPNASLVFYWSEQERQVCISGEVARVPREESDDYFHSRPHGSQVGAWASHQSRPVKDRAELEARWLKIETDHRVNVPTPPHWGGYVLSPVRVEFWQGRPNRMHDRFVYSRKVDKSWTIDRLAP